ncbi:MAG TPA: ABC transporter permease [Thermoanaerobaculia bacterium]|nr:ABC transporter permease [Thermoanaerobaculia bacterium]
MSHPAAPSRILARLLRAPSFALLASTTLALAIGADVAIFSLVNTILLRPLPYPEPERLVGLWHAAPGLELGEMPQSAATYARYRAAAESLESIGLVSDRQLTLTGEAEPERLSGAAVSASLFDVLRVVPALGRPLQQEEELPGAAPVATLSHGLWKRRFGSDPSIVGRTVRIDGVAREVIGVMPEGFAYPEVDTELWVPLEIDPTQAPLGAFNWRAIGRMKPGVERATLEADLNRLLGDLPTAFPGDPAAPVLANAGFRAFVRDLREDVVGDVAPALWILLGAVGLIFLIGCANVANLFLVRADGRRHEIAVRAALGETRGRLVSGLLIESTALGLAGGIGGLGLAILGVKLLGKLGAATLPRLHEHAIDARVLLFTLGVSLVAGLLLGLPPALRAMPQHTSIELAEGGRRSTGSRSRHRTLRLLVAAQVALATVLLVGSGLATFSFYRLSQVDPGFRPEGLLTFRLALPQQDYPEAKQVADFHRRTVERLRSLPGVASAGAASWLPLTGQQSGAGHSIEDFPRGAEGVPPVYFTERVTNGYFETMGIPLVEGRDFTSDEQTQGRQVVIVSATIVNELWPGRSALGKRILPGRPPARNEDWFTIVGVAGPVRDPRLQDPPRNLVYYPSHVPSLDDEEPIARGMAYALRVQSGDPAALASGVREVVRELDPNLPVANVEPMSRIVARAKARIAFSMVLLLIAAGAALLLGCVGLYGVVSYAMRQRIPEMAVRMALGARPGDIRGMVLADGLLIGAAGVVLGLAGSAALTRLMSAVLYEVSPFDPLVFAAASVLPFAVFLLSTFLPASRAAAVDPATALRHD